MGTRIFYYTGTGNSLWVARQVAGELAGADLRSISARTDLHPSIESGTLGLVFPVYIWGVPAPVIRFVDTLTGREPEYTFAIAVNAGQVSNTLVQLKTILAKNSVALSAGFEIRMPSNYIPWGGPGPREEQSRRFELARLKIARIARSIKGRESLPVEKGPLWQRLLFSVMYKMSFSHVPTMDRNFRVDDTCTACGICVRVCPAQNVTLQEGRPLWHHQCEQCFACLQWCPAEAIQYGRKTPGYERYHHPEILLEDVLNSR